MGLNNSQYDAIMRNYNKKQFANKHNQDKRIVEVYNLVPQIEELDSSIGTMAVSQAKKMLEGDKTALGRLKEEFQDLQEQREVLLASGGFPMDYMDMRYHCKDCKDTGYMNNKKCHCFRQAVIEQLYTQSNLKEILTKENFETFSYDFFDRSRLLLETGVSQYEYMKSITVKCWNFIDTFDSRTANLLFTGTTGVGKTFLSHCIANELIKRFYSVIYLSATELFDILSRNKFEYDNEEDAEMYHYILDCDLLIIDDLGTELTNTFTISQLFYCINERLLGKKSVIISTNLSINMLNDIYTERIISRIMSEYDILDIYGDDIRIQKKLSGKMAP